jgi:ribosomal protein S18 acetylase RimI-like enzyme
MKAFSVVKSKPAHLEELMRWFPDGQAAYLWGGPFLRYPLSIETFLEDIHWGTMASWSGLDEEQNLRAFGQYYEKGGFCHLARLAVDPQHRKSGIGNWFISELMSIGMEDLGLDACSLFVLEDNAAAVGCYRKIGFRSRAWPAWQERLEGIGYMIAH